MIKSVIYYKGRVSKMRLKVVSVLLSVIVSFGIFASASFASTENSSEMKFDVSEFESGEIELNKNSKALQEKFNMRKIEIDKYLTELSDLNAMINNYEVKVENHEYVSQKEKALYNKNLKEYKRLYENSDEIVGLELLQDESTVETSEEISILSSSSYATMPYPTLYYDNDSQAYVLGGSWKWTIKNNDFNNSGYDAVALRVNHERITVFKDGHGLRTYDRLGNRFTPAMEPLPSGYGIGIKFHDYGSGDTYSASSGSAWVYFRFYNGTPQGKLINFTSTYSHTFSGVAINGINVSSTGFGISWSSTSNHWEKTNYSTKQF